MIEPPLLDPDLLRPRTRAVERSTIERGWTAAILVSAYGLRIGFRLEDISLLQPLIAILPPGWRSALGKPVADRLHDCFFDDAESAQPWTCQIDGAIGIRVASADALLEWLERDLHHYVATFSRRMLFVHAGVVGWHGQAILLPGRSFAGKSTLVHALVAAGAAYYSDEYAVVDGRGRVHPFPRHLRMRTVDGGTAGRLDPNAITEVIGGPPLPVGMVADLRFDARAGWNVTTTSAGTGALAVLGNTVAARHRPVEALQTLSRAVTAALILRGTRGEAPAAAQHLLAALVESGPGESDIRNPQRDGARGAAHRSPVPAAGARHSPRRP